MKPPPLLSLLFLFFSFGLLFTCSNAQTLTFSISAAFNNVVPQATPYYDLCGFPCPSSGFQTRSDFCDDGCRQNWKCKTFMVGGLCFMSSWDSYMGPFCYTNGCPSIFNQNFASTYQLRWGQPAESTGMSGMGFNAQSGALPVQQEFVLGTLTHYNFPIYAGTFVTSYSFLVTLNIFNSGTPIVSGKVFRFDMQCDETTNSLTQRGCGGSCPYDSRLPLSCWNGQPLCPDKISIRDGGVTNTVFNLFGATYTLALSGFRVPGQTSTLQYFISDEGRFLSANMYAVITPACPTCDPGKSPFFDIKKLSCSCPCASGCAAGLEQQPDCSCTCPKICNIGAKTTAGLPCSCRCDTGQCTAPRVPSAQVDSRCSCICPNNCARGGVPNQNSPTCACTNCPACPTNFQNDAQCNCVCALTAQSCGPTQVFNPNTCSCDCKFRCPAGQWDAQSPSPNCGCSCNAATLSSRCSSMFRTTLIKAWDPATNNQDAACNCGPCITNYSPDPQAPTGTCKCSLTCTNQNVLDPAKCSCFCPPGSPKCSYPQIPNPDTCSCTTCTFPNGCLDACKSTIQTCTAQNKYYVFNQTTCQCTNCINRYELDSKGTCVCNLTPQKCGGQYTVSKDCDCVCPSGAPVCSYPLVPDPATCSCRQCTDLECRNLCEPTRAVCAQQNREYIQNSTNCGCGKCLNLYDDNNGKNAACTCNVTPDKCPIKGQFWKVSPTCTCECPTDFVCTYPNVPERSNCSCRACQFPAECQTICPKDLVSTCAAQNRVAIFNATHCQCGDCMNRFQQNPTTKKCDVCPLTNIDLCKSQYPNSDKGVSFQAFANLTTCTCNCPADVKCNPPQIFDPSSCSCVACDPNVAGNTCSCNYTIAYCANLNRTRVFTPTECRCGDCFQNFKGPAATTAACTCPLNPTVAGCEGQASIDLDKCQCSCPPGKPVCNYPDIRVSDVNNCSCRPCKFPDECTRVCNIENDCLAQHRNVTFTATKCECGPCQGNFVDPPGGKGACVCNLKGDSPTPDCGGPGSQAVPDNITCTCSCPPGFPKCEYPNVVDLKKPCHCRKCDNTTSECLTTCTKNCTALSRELDMTLIGKACECGKCLGNLTESVPGDTNSPCVCKQTPETCGGPGSIAVPDALCRCTCPVLPICTYPLIPDASPKSKTYCNCRKCNFPDECPCPSTIKDSCIKLNRGFIFDANTCGCGPCINNFTDTDPVKRSTNCTQCDLKDQSCRTQNPRSLFVVDPVTCTCVCPAVPKCPGEFDIYEPSTCSCRDCKAGECICGNKKVEPGEECDEDSECCSNCKYLVDTPCNKNKCGLCKKSDPASNATTCQDNGAALCPNYECLTQACTVVGNVAVCNQTFLSGPCGPKPQDLCLRRCYLGNCTAYSDDVVATRCPRANAPPECGECCDYKCAPSTGQCAAIWDGRLNTTCNDNKLCTINDTCLANNGSDSATVPLVCKGVPKCTAVPAGFPCMKLTCSEDIDLGSCREVPTGSNTTCPAKGFCGLEGKCSSTGECIRPRRSCISNNTCLIGRCRDAEARCEYLPELANGLPCEDNNNCTTNKVCSNGICNGTNICNGTGGGGPNLAIPLGVTGAVVATGAAAAGFFVYKSMQAANLMDPVTWGDINKSQFDTNPLYQDQTRFGENPLYNS